MQLVEQHIVRDPSFMELCVKAKRLYNQALYYWRQSIFGKLNILLSMSLQHYLLNLMKRIIEVSQPRRASRL
jgi:hypothetical protein